MSKRTKRIIALFEEAVAGLRHAYPEESRHTTFVLRFGLRGRRAVKDWFNTCSKSSSRRTVRSILADSKRNGVFYGSSNIGKPSLISFNLKRGPRRGFPVLEDPYFTLHHEFGHRLYGGKENRRHENAADIFALLYGYAKADTPRISSRNFTMKESSGR